ncbi:Protein of unknown function [Pyronema omphalodes CBS 100304]|uniref:Uncharacterized protein n=1 Tax=Pyronema omphalodes (strain CBS 100304) TaxID=1076935 RepID=U4LSB9_PYROM|nr:Protein of unknown function [Pyronema omphalodes CBS 100304]
MTKFPFFTRSRSSITLPSTVNSSPMCLSPTLEDRWSAALARAPPAVGISEMNLPEELEQRWTEAWTRVPDSVSELPVYLQRMLPQRPTSAPPSVCGQSVCIRRSTD